MNISARVRAVVSEFKGAPFYPNDIFMAIPDQPWRKVLMGLRYLMKRGELAGEKVSNPKGHGKVTRYTQSEMIPQDARKNTDIGDTDAALRLAIAMGIPCA